MYFVDRSKIEETLVYIDKLLTEINDKTFTSRIEKLGLERSAHLIIESMLDVGNMMIDGFIMRDPGSYHDIIDILIDEQVIPAKDELAYKEVIDLREMLVKNYLAIDDDLLAATMTKHHPTLESFSSYVREYLINELGVANAFSNED